VLDEVLTAAGPEAAGGALVVRDQIKLTLAGARPASAATAQTKAITAATFRQASGPVPGGSNQPDVLLNLSLQNAAAASGGKITTLLGGVPIVVDGQVVGAVGVGGGSGEQDAEVAKAGVAAVADALKGDRAHRD
jgi:glc operon protein GlcG